MPNYTDKERVAALEQQAGRSEEFEGETREWRERVNEDRKEFRMNQATFQTDIANNSANINAHEKRIGKLEDTKQSILWLGSIIAGIAGFIGFCINAIITWFHK